MYLLVLHCSSRLGILVSHGHSPTRNMTADLPGQIRRVESLVTDVQQIPQSAAAESSQRCPGQRCRTLGRHVGVGGIGDHRRPCQYALPAPNLILGPILAFYFARDKDQIRRKVMSWIPARSREEVSNLIGEIDAVVGGFVRGQLLVAMIMAVMISVGLWLAGIDSPFLIGTAAGILDLIPYFGPLLGAIPALMIGVLKSPLHILYVAAVFAAANQIETAVLSPRIVSGYVGLHPLVVIFSLLAGAYIWGLLGMIVAVPLAGILRVLLRYTWTRIVEQ